MPRCRSRQQVLPRTQPLEEAALEMSTQVHTRPNQMLCLVDVEDDSKLKASCPKPTIVIADDHHPMLEEISRVLEGEFDVVASAPDGALAVRHASRIKPDVVVLDIHMPGMSGIEAARDLIRSGSSAKIILLTIETDPAYVELAISMGVSYVVKSRLHRDLILAIKEALAGRMFVSTT